MDLITYALCKKFTRETVDGILAGSADLTQYYKKGEVNDLIKDFITMTDLPTATALARGMVQIGKGLNIDDDGLVTIDENSVGMKTQVASTLPSDADADNNILYFVPDRIDSTKLIAYVHTANEGWIKVGGEPTLGLMMLAVTAKKTDLSSVDKFYILDGADNAVSVSYDDLLNNMSGKLKLSTFKGATETEDGEAGLVPKPLAGEQNKFLRANGKWSEISGTPLDDDDFLSVSDVISMFD